MRKVLVAAACVGAACLFCDEGDPGGMAAVVATEALVGSWRLVDAACELDNLQSCRVELQPCPSFYVFDGVNVMRHETTFDVVCGLSDCDTTVNCYGVATNPYIVLGSGAIEAWGDRIDVSIHGDTLVFVRHHETAYPTGTYTKWFVREDRAVPYGEPPCTCQ